MSDVSSIPTPHTQEAIRRHAHELSIGTGWRWMNGIFPSIIHWIVAHEDVADALLQDARAFSKSEKQAA